VEVCLRTLLVVLGLCGLWLTPIPDVAHGVPSQVRQVGLASWYGKQHQGRKTASGERFLRQQLTAVHRSLPLETKVKGTNLWTKQQVVVTIEAGDAVNTGGLNGLSEDHRWGNGGQPPCPPQRGRARADDGQNACMSFRFTLGAAVAFWLRTPAHT
jgi:rare lipoprotein A